MSDVHFLVLIHGMWGNPTNLSEMARIIREEKSSLGDSFEVLAAQTNRDESTYDGVDWGAERVANEIYAAIKKIEEDGKRKVTKFSVTGYSFGGLVGRYVIGILHQRSFFDTVRPVNFNTFATPHIGLPRYPSFFSSLAHKLGPNLLSRTGEHFYAKDNWSGTGQPLVEVMADPKRVFYQALALFPNIVIYANALHDTTVPYVTAAIEANDPFAEYETNGIEVELDDEYPNLIKHYALPDVPPTKPKFLSAEWWKNSKPSRPFLPPYLQKKFPLNIVIYSLIPLLIPTFISFALVHLSLASRSSRRRVKLLEKEDANGEGAGKRLALMFAQLEKGMDDMVIDLMDEEGAQMPTNEEVVAALAAYSHSNDVEAQPSSSGRNLQFSSSDPEAQLGPTTTTTTLAASPSPEPPISSPSASKSSQPVITPLQRRIIASLNSLPQLRKHLVYFPNVRHSHATIVCRDDARFSVHRAGEGGLKHWAVNFVI